MTKAGAIITSIIAWLSSVTGTPVPEEFIRVPPLPAFERKANIIFGGDVMFDRTVRLAMDENGSDFILSCIAETLRDADLAVVNLEGPITTHPSMSLGSEIGSPENFTFTFPTSTAGLLKRHNISLVALGNNHIKNFGGEGVVQTKDWLARAGVRHFGDPYVNENDRVARIDVGGIPFSFVSWSDWTGGTREEVLAQIRNERAAERRPVVVAHWGEEYMGPTETMRSLAHAFIDAGAIIVVGAHPHIVHEPEFYQGVPIYYSLGNLVFDQYWNDDVRTGLLVRVFFDEHGVYGVDEFETYLESDRRTCLKGE